jgi:hypothetical protein
MTKSDITKKAMIEALTKSLGIVTTACQTCKISRETHYKWYREDAEYKAAVDDVQNVAIDFAESKLFQNVKDGKETSIIYYLNNKGNSRGYSKTNFIDLTSKGESIQLPPIIIEHKKTTE